MQERERKLEALRRLAAVLKPDGTLLVLFGFLAGRLDSVHFVRQLEGASVAVQLSVDTRIWPRLPFRGHVDGETILNAVAFADAIALRDDPIHVRVDFPWEREPEWYRAVAQDAPQSRRERLEQAIGQLRARIDLALDVYRMAKPKLPSSDEEERHRLQFMIRTAQEEIQALGRQLSELEAELDEPPR